LVLPFWEDQPGSKHQNKEQLNSIIIMEKKAYIKPYTVVNLIDGKEDLMFVINDKSFEAGGAPAKERDELEEEEAAAAAAMAAQQQNYSLW
jgi:hypothetical protein